MSLAVEFKGLTKAFHGVVANAGLNLQVKRGSIHAIIGENGAGKSTAMKLLYGTYQPDSGEVWVDGKLWGGRMKPWSSPSDAIQHGIGMVHQHFMLSGPHTVLENLMLGVGGLEDARSRWKLLPRVLRPMDRAKALQKLKSIATQYGMSMDWHAPVEKLPVGIQQRIEILKLLFRDAQILILDEPTAVLTPQETADLFENLKRLRDEGKTILIITHKLKEVMALADRVTVMRAGQGVGERNVAETQIEELALLMVGRKVKFEGEPPPAPVLNRPVLEVRNVQYQARCSLKGLDFQVHGGEVVGIAGVEGNGQSELLQLLLHPHAVSSRWEGSIAICEKEIRPLSTLQIKELGVGVIPEDRHRDGLMLDRPLSENFLLGLQRRKPFQKFGLIDHSVLQKTLVQSMDEFDIRPRAPEGIASGFSGGNQQKMIIAREFQYAPRFLIAAQPTRGVDVGAIEFIHQRILQARAQGTGVLLISSELEEILALSDRIFVMYEGRMIAEFCRGEVTEKVLGLRMGGALQA